MTTDLVCAPGKVMSILSVSETFRRRRDGKEWLVIDFSIGQIRLNEKSKDVICIFEEFGEAEVGRLQWFCILNEETKNTRLYELVLG